MPSKKNATTKSKKKKTSQRRKTAVAHFSKVWGAADVLPLIETGNGQGKKQPYCLNPETSADREKRLADRKALTLKAFQIAYDNHRQRKTS